MTNDLQRALDSVADYPTPDFVARLASEIERVMSSTAVDIPVSLDVDLLEVPAEDDRPASARPRVWRTTAIALASAAVIAAAVAVANPFRRDASPIYTGSTLTETTPPNPTVTPTSAITSSPTTTKPPETTPPTTLVSSVPPVSTDRWEALPDLPMKSTFKPLVVALGAEVLVAGGYGPSDRMVKTAGAVFDGRTWREIPDAPVPLAAETSAVWTGSVALLVSADGTIMTFTPGPDRWDVLGKAPLPNRIGAQVTWTGEEMLLASGGLPGVTDLQGGMNIIDEAVAYRPSTDTWRTIPRPPTKDSLTGQSVWTGKEWVRTVGWSEGKFDDFGSIAAYNPTTNSWQELPLLPTDQPPTAILMEGDELIAYTSAGRWRLAGETWLIVAAIPAWSGYGTGTGGAWFVGGHPIRAGDDNYLFFEALDAKGSWQHMGDPFPYGVDAVVRTTDDRLIVVRDGKAARLRMP
jgi:hypothetical protein